MRSRRSPETVADEPRAAEDSALAGTVAEEGTQDAVDAQPAETVDEPQAAEVVAHQGALEKQYQGPVETALPQEAEPDNAALAGTVAGGTQDAVDARPAETVASEPHAEDGESTETASSVDQEAPDVRAESAVEAEAEESESPEPSDTPSQEPVDPGTWWLPWTQSIPNAPVSRLSDHIDIFYSIG